TMFRGIHKLPAGHLLICTPDKVTVREYWDLSFHTEGPHHEQDCRDQLREILREAVRLRLRSDVPLGAFLSGGVDSSAVVAAMAQQAAGRMKTFTIGFPNERVDERRYAREVAKLFDTDHHELVVEPNLVEALPRLVWHYGEHFADQAAIPSFYLSEMTRRDVTVALNGDGGDESFGGYRRYIGNDLARRLEIVPAIAARATEALLVRVGTGHAQDTKRARLLR